MTSNLKNFTSIKLETSGFYQLSSCNNGQQAYEDVTDMKHGVFSYYLIEGLGGAADKRADGGKGGNGDGQISLDELRKYVSTKTANYVHNEMKKTQTPTFSSMDTSGDSPIMALYKTENVEVASTQTSSTREQTTRTLTTAQPIKKQQTKKPPNWSLNK